MSMAARALLIKSVTSTIPSYVMQTVKLPVATVQQLEKVIRGFFLGGQKEDALSCVECCLQIKRARRTRISEIAGCQ